MNRWDQNNYSSISLSVLHIPTTVGGNPQGLSSSLQQFGVNSCSWALQQNYLEYAVDKVIWHRHDGFFIRECKRWSYIIRALRGAKVIHLNFGTSLAWPVVTRKTIDRGWTFRVGRWVYGNYTWWAQWVELSLYNFFGKVIAVHYQGDDARQGDISLLMFENCIARVVDANYYDPPADNFKRRCIRRMDRFADLIYSVNPDLLHVLPKRTAFVPYCHISLSDWSAIEPRRRLGEPLRIGHAPSNRQVKGTEHVIAAVEHLKASGHPVELVLVEGLSNEQARAVYQTVDVLIDQLHAGWYGGLAVEAMALGKPVLVYIRQGDLEHIPAAMRDDLPFIQIEPDTIAEGILQVLSMPHDEFVSLSQRSRKYVERWHDPLKIAASVLNDYERILSAKAGRQQEPGQAP